MQPITADGFARPQTASDPGPAPMLQWLRIADLVVDAAYQRPIRGEGVRNVQKIAAAFSWACFAPVIVSPVAGGKYAIVDGQHRTTAAAICGMEQVPCQIVVAGQAEQARAFKAINGLTTKMTRIALHTAAVVSGDASARAIQEVCAAATVEILRYPVPRNLQKPGQTMAIGCIADCLSQYGRETLITALQCVTETANREKAGLLVAAVIRALCDALHGQTEWRDAGVTLFEVFDEIDIEKLLDEAQRGGRAKGVSVSGALSAKLVTAISEGFGAGG